MNLKLLIFRARSNGIPVYCCFVFLVYIAYNKFCSKPPQTDRVPEDMEKYVNYNKPVKFPTRALSSAELGRLTITIEMMNYEREVQMAWRYGPVRSDTNMVVVQVHRDLERLQFLIMSLEQVRNIQSVLLVFSHSYYNDVINKLVSSIKFCRFMQIFYPYSVQLYPNKFPGVDPDDCLHNNNKVGCSNRDGRLTEHKHHWWWKAFFIFNELDWSANYKGTVIFLEENNYVLPDLLYMLRYTTRSKKYLQGIRVMSFGRPYAKDLDYDLLSVSAWRPPYDKGLAFNRTVWQKISFASWYYCTYDDLSWSYSLLNVFSQLPGGHAEMVATMAPRVLSTSVFPSGRAAFEHISLWLGDAKMFPLKIKAVMLYGDNGRVDNGMRHEMPPPWGNGGWSDLRDHLLCQDPLMATTTGFPRNFTARFQDTSYDVTDTDFNAIRRKANISDINIHKNF